MNQGGWPEQVRRALRDQAGIDVVALTPAAAGESGNAFWLTDRAGTQRLLKIASGPAPDPAGYLRALGAVTGLLAGRGYPAARIVAAGQVAGLAFWVQERLPGVPLDRRDAGPDQAAIGRLLPELLRLNDAQTSPRCSTTPTITPRSAAACTPGCWS